MRADGQLPAKRLLNRCRHGLLVAGMAAAGDVDRSKRGHQRFLGAISNGLRQLAHVAIEVDADHPRIRSSDVSNFSCSTNRERAVSQSTRSKRISSRGRSCPRLCRSAEITLAIFAYPPVVCCSTNKIIGEPAAVICTAPSATPSVIISSLVLSEMDGP